MNNWLCSHRKNRLMIAHILFVARKNISALMFFVLISLPATLNAQEPLNAHPAVWLIEQENSKTYFLGSIHLLPQGINWYGGKIETIFEQTDEVAFEVHMTPEKEAKAQQIMIANGRLPDGEKLSNYLEPEEYETVLEQARIIGIPTNSIANFKPWFASLALSVTATIKQGWDPESGVDKFIEKLARKKNIPIAELETVEEQMATLYDHPFEIQADMLIDTLDQLKEIETVTTNMASSWGSGDEEKMKEAFVNPLQQQREIYRKLITQRNTNWIPVIEKLMAKEQTTLVVAGAAHFIGDGGLVGMLENKGYEIKRVQ